jgi:hypothetical protein
MTETDFYRRPNDLRPSMHPVPWLRIQLVDRLDWVKTEAGWCIANVKALAA